MIEIGVQIQISVRHYHDNPRYTKKPIHRTNLKQTPN